METKTGIFISWSGDLSQVIAEAIKKSLITVFNEIEVYFTPEDIGTGKLWPHALAEILQKCDIGLLIYTQQNLDNLWMAFEAGALSKKTNSSLVIPIIFGANIADIKAPLSQFQGRRFDKDGIFKTLEDINNLLPKKENKEKLNERMEVAWSYLEDKINKALSKIEQKHHTPQKDIGEKIDNLFSFMKRLADSPSFTNDIAKLIDKTNELSEQIQTTKRGSYLFIEDEKPAFSALIAATMRAKEIIRSTRFSPMSIVGNQDEYGKAIYNRVLGEKPVSRYARIIAANKREKLKDIDKYFNNFCGKNFDLYLTKRENSFELVIIDDEEVFIHFYGEGKVIKSTLHIVGQEVTKNFIEIYSRLHDPKHDPDILKIEFKYLREGMIPEQKKRVEQFFDESLIGSD